MQSGDLVRHYDRPELLTVARDENGIVTVWWFEACDNGFQRTAEYPAQELRLVLAGKWED